MGRYLRVSPRRAGIDISKPQWSIRRNHRRSSLGIALRGAARLPRPVVVPHPDHRGFYCHARNNQPATIFQSGRGYSHPIGFHCRDWDRSFPPHRRRIIVRHRGGGRPWDLRIIGRRGRGSPGSLESTMETGRLAAAGPGHSHVLVPIVIYPPGQCGVGVTRCTPVRNQRGRQCQRDSDELSGGQWAASRFFGGVRDYRGGVAGVSLADLRRHFLRDLGDSLHHHFQQHRRNFQRLLAGHGLLDRPARRGPGKPTLVLLFRRSFRVRVVAGSLRGGRSSLFSEEGGRIRLGIGLLGRLNPVGLHHGVGEDALVAGKRCPPLYFPVRQVPGRPG